jgi:molecular chaperone GrpE
MADEKSPVDDEPIEDANADSDHRMDDSVDAADAETSAEQDGPVDEAAESETDDSASLETQVEELKETVLRAQADLQNVRRRAERDVESAHKYAIEKFTKDLLAVLDSMDRALELAETTEGFDVAMLEGTQMTHKLLLDTVAKHGVEPIDPAGEPFDPQAHQAMSMVESAEHPPSTVMTVMQKGYTLEGRVLRPAMVVVTKAPADT